MTTLDGSPAHSPDGDALPIRNWFALEVKTNHEQAIQESPYAAGIEFFHPTYTDDSRRKDRRASVERALFPGYLFARFDLEQSAAAVSSIAGVFGIVSFDNQPASIPDDQIESVRKLLASGRTVSPCPYVPVNKGDRVEIKYGVCAGMVGSVVRLRGKSHDLFVLTVEGVNQSLSVTVPRDCIRPVKKAA